jgi:hypothetical protein
MSIYVPRREPVVPPVLADLQRERNLLVKKPAGRDDRIQVVRPVEKPRAEQTPCIIAASREQFNRLFNL